MPEATITVTKKGKADLVTLTLGDGEVLGTARICFRLNRRDDPIGDVLTEEIVKLIIEKLKDCCVESLAIGEEDIAEEWLS